MYSKLIKKHDDAKDTILDQQMSPAISPLYFYPKFLLMS